MPVSWIDFKLLRQNLPFLDLLKFYNVPVTVKGEQGTGLCPLPDHPKRENDGRRTPSFSCHLRRKIWRCFGCSKGGNILDLAVRLEGLDPENPKNVRKVAVKLARHFGLTETPAEDSHPKARAPDTYQKPVATPSVESKPHRPIQINPSLDFTLRGLDPLHPYFAEHGIMPQTVERFELGYCARGMLKHRIAIPIHDRRGQLVGYAGRLTKDRDVSEKNPKYRFPGDRERDGVRIEFRKSALLYNLHRIAPSVDELIIVEGFRSVWHLHQLDCPNVVALMGASCSPEQARLILDAVQEHGRLVFLADGDAAGKACALSMFNHLAPHRWCKWAVLQDGQQPTDLNKAELASYLNRS